MTLWRRHFTCWIPKATNTLFTICNTAFPLQQKFQEHASVLRYTYVACSVHYVSCGVLVMTTMNTAIQDVTLYVVLHSFKILVGFYQTTQCHILEHVNH